MTVPNVAEMASHVLPYNLTRAMNIIGIKPLMTPLEREAIPRPNTCRQPVQTSLLAFLHALA